MPVAEQRMMSGYKEPLSGFALAILEEQKAVHFSQRRKSQIFRPLEQLLVG